MDQVSARDLEAIKEWLAKEPSLPKNFDDEILCKFLFSCLNSLERTKQCIEEFCTRRANMPELYCDRDPMSLRMRNVFAYTYVVPYSAGNDEVLIHHLLSVPDHFDFYDVVKAFTIQADHWIRREAHPLPENHIMVIDLKYYTMKLVAKSNIFFLQKFIVFLLECMPVRLKQVHLINCPSFVDYLYNMVKPALPEYLLNMVRFHADYKGLHNFIDKRCLPTDYEGDCPSLTDLNEHFVKDICDNRELYLDDNRWKADLSMKQKTSSTNQQMSGSFRTLDFD